MSEKINERQRTKYLDSVCIFVQAPMSPLVSQNTDKLEYF